MSGQCFHGCDRRNFLTQFVPACSVACLGIGSLGAKMLEAGNDEVTSPGVHKFDVESSKTTTPRQRLSKQNRNQIEFIKTLQGELEERELIRLLNLNSAKVGRMVGKQQAERSPDTSFRTFVATFRPPRYADTLTHEVVEDTEKVFELRVTECIWAAVYRDAGLGGEIGHAAVCNMDYYWPQAFNKSFKMEREKTLMQGHSHCNHRYLNTT